MILPTNLLQFHVCQCFESHKINPFVRAEDFTQILSQFGYYFSAECSLSLRVFCVR